MVAKVQELVLVGNLEVNAIELKSLSSYSLRNVEYIRTILTVFGFIGDWKNFVKGIIFKM